MADFYPTPPRRLRRLILEYEEYREDVGNQAADEAVAAALNAIHGKRSRVDAIARQIDELRREAHWLAEEIRGREAGLELMLQDAIRRWDHLRGRVWSPTPVLGFRAWGIGPPGGLRGVRVIWRARRKTAECSRSGHGRPPHSDGRCGRLGCGIYAAKDVHELAHSRLLDGVEAFVIGLVALTGKVVEHESGYRAEHAELIAACAVSGQGYLETEAGDVIDALFEDPAGAVARLGRPMTPEYLIDIRKYLVGCRERRERVL